jgi:hypothetical protein
VQRLEEIEQAKVVKWSHKRAVRELMPALAWMFHCPNGMKRSAFTGAQGTALGVVKGVPDLLLPVHQGNSPGYLGLVVEMKYGKGKESKEQTAWLNHFQDQGWRVSVCYSAEEARRDICTYFGINPDTAPALDA